MCVLLVGTTVYSLHILIDSCCGFQERGVNFNAQDSTSKLQGNPVFIADRPGSRRFGLNYRQ